MKPHFPILDGLRGTAAILVVIFHLCEAYFLDRTTHPMQHGHLAVDFFYLLSGFVVGYAYDDRWGKLTVGEFFKVRLIRLHPLVIWSVIIGGLTYWFNPFAEAQNLVPFTSLLVAMLVAFTVLPSPDIHSWGESHSLNGPAWSLLQEYIANILYALIGRRLNKTGLWIVVIIAAIALLWLGNKFSYLGVGWSYETFWYAPVRMIFPFFAGLLLFRTGKLIKLPMAYPVCSILLIALFLLPAFKYNGLFEAAMVILIFPLIVAAGAGSQISGKWEKLCKFSGAISYPLYIIHYPFIYLFADWMAIKKPSANEMILAGISLFIFFILLAYLSLKLYDEPLRVWLKKKFIAKTA
jgi:peptidoglycan/LPS O-acetylase OafA/YrhL